jgi:hypothetical protein
MRKISVAKYLFCSILFSLLYYQSSFAQKEGTENVFVDSTGVLRWSADKEEIKGFGVNYTTPFAHAYRSAKKLGIDPLEAIDQDVYHFSRLGFDLYRVHVWDTEISDTLGNLLFNEHLHAFDYLLKKLAERNINYVITPIAFWGNGWPEPDLPSPGFSAKYGKGDCLTNPDAIKAQENYLEQFMNHVNPYTGIAYKDDPRLIAVEVSNEPHHREAPEKVTTFVQSMVDAIRKSGYQKPIFYNISHSVHLAEDYFKADIQGGTFQWYPTGLGYQKELPINALLNVDKYDIPFDEVIKNNKGAKIVYEFDAADIAKSYVYPAMARSFRTAGIQLATHFAYDPTFLANTNTEYNTHHMNLVYTPQKALSLLICSEVFHQIPMYKNFGSYPENTTFEGFEVSYEKNLAQLNVADKFYYTNHTLATPVDESNLKKIAGFGNSPIIKYDGTGAYFLDQLENGIWRLEVMPDAAIVSNPYGRNSLNKEVAVVQWNERAMNINLKDLGTDFQITSLKEDNDFETTIKNGNFNISPGVYFLVKKGVKNNWQPNDTFGNIQLNEFHAPKSSINKTYVTHQKPMMAVENQSLLITAEVVTPNPTTLVQILIEGPGGGAFTMERKEGFHYEALIQKEKINKGFFNYYIIVRQQDKVETYPVAEEGFPWDWDFYNRNPYTIRVIGKEQPIYLYNAQEEGWNISYTRWMNTLKLVPLDQFNESEYQINIQKLFQPDNENKNGKTIHDYTLKSYVNYKIGAVRKQLADKKKLVFKARSLNDKPTFIQVALTTADGKAFGKTIEIGTKMQEYEILISELLPIDLVIMPRPYPTFLPYYFSSKKSTEFDIGQIEGVQFSIGPGVPNQDLESPHGMAIVSLRLE